MALGVVSHFSNSGLARAIGATIEGSIGLHAVADNLAAAVIANRRELVNRAFETVKGVAGTRGDDFEG